MTVKEELGSIAKSLESDATWDDVLYEIQVRRKIAAGLKAVDEGRTLSHGEIKQMFLP